MQLGIALAGFIVGVLVGLTGVGGGALMTPLLIVVAGVSPISAIGADLVYSTVTKAVGAWQHWRQGTVNLHVAGLLSIGGVPGALLGVQLVYTLAARGVNIQPLLLHALGAMLIVVGCMLLLRTLFPGFLRDRLRPLNRHWRSATITWGAVVGITVGLTSVGSGSLVLPLLFLLPMTTSERIGTGIVQSALMVSVAGLLYIWHGQVDFRLAGNLLIGSIPGILLGSHWVARVSPRPLRLSLGGVLLLTAIHLLA